MWGIPIGLLVRGAMILVAVVAFWWAWHKFTGHYEHIGEVRVQTKWDAQKKVDQEAQQAQERAWGEAVTSSETKASSDVTKTKTEFIKIRERATALPTLHAGYDAAFERLFLDARNSAEAARATPLPAEAAPAPSSSTTQYILDLNEWAAGAIRKDDQWRSFYNDLRKGQPK